MLNYVKKIIEEFRKKDPSHPMADSKRDWKFLLILFFCLALIVLLVDYTLLASSASHLTDTAPDTTLAGLSINRAQLSDTLGSWKIKETKFNGLLGSKPEVLIDPSL